MIKVSYLMEITLRFRSFVIKRRRVSLSDLVTLVCLPYNVSTCNGETADGTLTIDSFQRNRICTDILKDNGAFVETEAAIESAAYGPGTYMIKEWYDGNNPPGWEFVAVNAD
jgi:hypothetical protein